MIKNKKTIDLANVDLDGTEDSNDTSGLTGLDLGLKKRERRLDQFQATQDHYTKRIDLSNATTVTSHAGEINVQPSSPSRIASQIAHLSTRKDAMNRSVSSDSRDKTSEFGLNTTDDGDIEGSENFSLSSYNFEDHRGSVSGIHASEPSKLEKLDFHAGKANDVGKDSDWDMDTVKKGSGTRSRYKLLLLLALIFLGLLFAFSQMQSDGTLGDGGRLFSFIGDVFEDKAPQSTGKSNPPTVKKKAKERKAVKRTLRAVRPAAAPKGLSEKVGLDNPYWPLPNPAPRSVKSTRSLTPSLREKWRLGMSHRYPYRRFATIKQVRESHMQGTEVLLFSALDQPKLWARMEALLGLVELGLEVDIDTVTKVVGGARSHLIKNYIKKMSVDPTPADFYVMRQAIRVVDARNRLEILKVLTRAGGDTNSLYYAAAEFDPSETVGRWLRRKIQSRPLAGRYAAEYRVIAGDYLSQNRTSNITEQLAVQEIEVEELSDSEIVKEVSFFQDVIDGKEAGSRGDDANDGFDSIIEKAKKLAE